MDIEVSIIIPNYNKGELVRHSLESLLRQTFGDWEAIVVDDCSSDVSWKIIQEYSVKDTRIKAVRNLENMGGNFARNRGASMAIGQYLIFLDSDDWLADDCLQNRVNEFETVENDDVDLLIFPMMSTNNGKTGNVWGYGDKNNALISFLRHEIVWQTMMPMWRKVAFERIGRFDEAFPRLQDVELHTRALLFGVNYKFAEKARPDCFYFIDESRMTVNYEKAAENTAIVFEMYVAKMKKLIEGSRRTKVEKQHLIGALVESQLAAIAGIGKSYQAGKIPQMLRDALYDRFLTNTGGGIYVSLYALLYKLGVNRLKGVNYFYRGVGRIILKAKLFLCSWW